MSASPGRGLLLRVNTSGSTFVTAGGLRTKQVKRAVGKVEVTSADAAYGAVRSAFEGGALLQCQIVYPGAGYYQGGFVVTQLDESAPFDKEISSSLTLESSGVPAWTAGAPA